MFGRPWRPWRPRVGGTNDRQDRDDQSYSRFQDTPEPGGELYRLVAAEQAARTAAGPVARWWAELTAAAESAVTAGSLDDLLNQAVEMIRSALGADAAASSLRTSRETSSSSALLGGVARTSATTGTAGGPRTAHVQAPGSQLFKARGTLGRILTERKAIFVDDLVVVPGHQTLHSRR